LCRAVARDLEGYRGPSAVMGFDPRVGRWFARNAPDVVRGLVVSEANARTFSGMVRRHIALWRAEADFLAYDVRDLPSRFAAAQRARGLPVLTWTVSTPALLAKGREHADGWIAEAEGVATALRSA
jgi:glycerophosphoryl diester phosphodiesterase